MKKMTGAIYEDEELTLSDDDAVGYADTITGALERESKFLDTPRGIHGIL